MSEGICEVASSSTTCAEQTVSMDTHDSISRIPKRSPKFPRTAKFLSWSAILLQQLLALYRNSIGTDTGLHVTWCYRRLINVIGNPCNHTIINPTTCVEQTTSVDTQDSMSPNTYPNPYPSPRIPRAVTLLSWSAVLLQHIIRSVYKLQPLVWNRQCW